MNPIPTFLSEKEFDLIYAMRRIVSQDNKYEVSITTKNYPTGYMVTEYNDTFETGGSK